jgi:pSer/pThr/pTyr-binding forkhead associated (FHA) protein
LGRDANRCNITFAHDTPEISRVHCEVSFDETSKSFILRDNGSSFGTFLSTGDKLNIGQPYSITSGSRFYMANKGNMFEVSF